MLFFTIGLLLIAAIVALIIWWYVNYLHFYSGLKDVKSPITFPLVGTAWQIFGKNPKELYRMLDKNIRDYGMTIKESTGPLFGILTIDPDVLQFLMTNTSTINKARLYNFFHKWLGTGLLTSSDSKWRNRRKFLTPAYHFRILEQFIDVFDKNSDILVKKLKQRYCNEEINIHPLISLCALDIISETAMGTSINAQDDEESDFVKATKEMNKLLINRGINPLKMVDFTYQFTEDSRIEKKALNVIHSYTNSIIKTRKEQLLRDENPIAFNEDESGIKNKIPFLDLLLMSSFNDGPLSDKDIQEEVNTFMFEGHDTVSSGISFCLYEISRNEDVQLKILQEQKEIFQDDPHRETTLKDLQNMKYLEMVIKEGLRLYPPVPLYGRVFSEDVTYKNLHIKKDMEVVMFALSLHRNENFFENPEVFDPERFTPENQSKRHPFSYIPFSGGFRNCIGQKFAMLELKSLIGKMVRNFELHAIPGFEVDLNSEIILNSSNGIKMTLKSRVW